MTIAIVARQRELHNKQSAPLANCLPLLLLLKLIALIVTNFLFAGVCTEETTTVYSFENETLNITWPQTKLNMTVFEVCPCPGATNLQEATRVCGGTYSNGVEWNDPDISQCPELKESTVRLCIASSSSVRQEDTD